MKRKKLIQKILLHSIDEFETKDDIIFLAIEDKKQLKKRLKYIEKYIETL